MQTVYQVSWFNVAAEILPRLFGVVLLGVALVAFLRPRRGAKISRLIGFIFAAMLILAAGIFIISEVVAEGHQSIKALQTGQCRVVEGTVTVLEVGWPSGHGHNERIRIGTDEFQFSVGNQMTYHWVIRNGGPLTNGVYARLHVLGEDILKVEIKR